MFLQGALGRKIYRMADGGGSGGGDGGTGTGEKPWFDSFDPETKGYIQNKGLDKKTAAEAFVEVSKFHREAEKFVGAPAAELVRLPKDPGSADWEKVHQRLGKPADAKEYDFSSVKRTGDKALDQALSDSIRQAAWNANLSKEGAVRLAQDVVKHLDGVETSTAAIKADKLAEEKKALEKNWGTNYSANKVIADATAKRLAQDLGMPPEDFAAAVNALEVSGTLGYSKILEMFRLLGTKIGEDRFVNGPGGGGDKVMSVDQAKARKAELMRDEAWKARYMKNGADERREMLALDRIISGVK